MTTTNNKGLIPSLSSFLSYYKLRRRKNILFFECCREKAELLEAYLYTHFWLLSFSFHIRETKKLSMLSNNHLLCK